MINGGHDATAQLALASALNDCAVTTTKAGMPKAIQNRAVGLAFIRHIAITLSPAITGPTTPIWLMINSRLRLTDKTVSSRLALSPKWPTVTKPLPIELLDTNGVVQNHFEQKYPWQAEANRTIILINQDATPPDLEQIEWQDIQTQSKIKISTKRDRVLVYHLGVEKP